jgi:glutaredoxin
MDIDKTTLNILKPKSNEFTIYSKSGCKNCLLAKNYLKEKKLLFKIIDCDEYLIDDKDRFLNFIEELSGKEWKTFPMIFDGDNFVGGLKDLEPYIEKILDFNLYF